MPISPDEVSASGAPPADQWITGPGFVLALLKTGTAGPLHVVNVSHDAGELETWYRVTVKLGALSGYEPADLSVLNNHKGGIIELPPGQSVAVGMMINHLSTP